MNKNKMIAAMLVVVFSIPAGMVYAADAPVADASNAKKIMPALNPANEQTNRGVVDRKNTLVLPPGVVEPPTTDPIGGGKNPGGPIVDPIRPTPPDKTAPVLPPGYVHVYPIGPGTDDWGIGPIVDPIRPTPPKSPIAGVVFPKSAIKGGTTIVSGGTWLSISTTLDGFKTSYKLNLTDGTITVVKSGCGAPVCVALAPTVETFSLSKDAKGFMTSLKAMMSSLDSATPQSREQVFQLTQIKASLTKVYEIAKRYIIKRPPVY